MGTPGTGESSLDRSEAATAAFMMTDESPKPDKTGTPAFTLRVRGCERDERLQ